mmetsp:Transcript_48161/g.111567  ORF Transcript_48161/g.111567 Transcript_48161/m.111567 type:complete len:229 (+) Transcript_48161:649-1335(+)
MEVITDSRIREWVELLYFSKPVSPNFENTHFSLLFCRPVRASAIADQQALFTTRKATTKAMTRGGARISMSPAASLGTKNFPSVKSCGSECQSCFSMVSCLSSLKPQFAQKLSRTSSSSSAKGPSGSSRMKDATSGEGASRKTTGARKDPKKQPNLTGCTASRCVKTEAEAGPRLRLRSSKIWMASRAESASESPSTLRTTTRSVAISSIPLLSAAPFGKGLSASCQV